MQLRSIFSSAIFSVGFSVGFSAAALADTTDQKWQTRVVVEKQGDHCVDDPSCFNRYHPAIQPVARAKPGDHIIMHSRDALDSDLTLDSVAEDVLAVDLTLVHPMTGPIHIEGAERGDGHAVPSWTCPRNAGSAGAARGCRGRSGTGRTAGPCFHG